MNISIFQYLLVKSLQDSEIDPDWISNMLGIPISSAIFLLGIPLVLEQTFIPEKIRIVYKKYDTLKYKKINIIYILIIPFVLYLGNFGMVSYFKDFYLLKLKSKFLFYPSYAFIYYSISTFYFIFFHFQLINLFNKIILDKEFSIDYLLEKLFKEERYEGLNEISFNLDSNYEIKLMRNKLLLFLDYKLNSTYDGEVFRLLQYALNNLYLNNTCDDKEKKLILRRISKACSIYDYNLHHAHDLYFFKHFLNIFLSKIDSNPLLAKEIKILLNKIKKIYTELVKKD